MAPEGSLFLFAKWLPRIELILSTIVTLVVQNWKKGYSAKADIWSLGCICLEMWAGRRPWSDEEAIQAMFKVR